MVDAVAAGSGFNAAAYLNNIKGIAAPKSTTPPPASSTPTSSGSTTPTASTSAPTASSNNPGISSDLLSLLQETSSSSSTSGLLSNLLGSSSISSSDPLSGLYSTLLYQNSTTAPLQNAIAVAQQQQAQTAAENSPVTNILNSRNSALNAYNQTLLQNAQAVLKANSKLVA